MARHCVKWASGGKKGRGRKKARCRFGVVKRGRRRGQCLKTRRPRGKWTKAGRSGAKIYVKRGR
jgi:hypothetical protein